MSTAFFLNQIFSKLLWAVSARAKPFPNRNSPWRRLPCFAAASLLVQHWLCLLYVLPKCLIAERVWFQRFIYLGHKAFSKWYHLALTGSRCFFPYCPWEVALRMTEERNTDWCWGELACQTRMSTWGWWHQSSSLSKLSSRSPGVRQTTSAPFGRALCLDPTLQVVISVPLISWRVMI